MKKSLLALAVLALSAGVQAHGVTAGAAGSNTVVSGSASAATASGTGSATSSAFNQGYARTQVSVGGDVGSNSGSSQVQNSGSLLWGTATKTSTVEKSGNVEIHGVTETANMSGVVTTQSGSALALGAAGGVAKADAAGAGAFHTVSDGPQGSVVGGSSALTATGVASVGNGSNLQNAGMVSYFDASASADIKTTTVQTGKTVLGAFIPTAQPSQGDVKNAATSTSAGAVSTGGFAGAPAITNAGTAVGGTLNNASGAALANSSVKGQVSAAIVGGL